MTELKINARRGNTARGVCEVMATEKAELTCGVDLLTGNPLDTSERENERRRVRAQCAGLKHGFTLCPAWRRQMMYG